MSIDRQSRIERPQFRWPYLVRTPPLQNVLLAHTSLSNSSNEALSISDRLIQESIKRDGPCRIFNVFVDQNFSMRGILQKFEVRSSGAGGPHRNDSAATRGSTTCFADCLWPWCLRLAMSRHHFTLKRLRHSNTCFTRCCLKTTTTKIKARLLILKHVWKRHCHIGVCIKL